MSLRVAKQNCGERVDDALKEAARLGVPASWESLRTARDVDTKTSPLNRDIGKVAGIDMVQK